MKQLVSYITWGFLILFAAPTIMVIASWDSLPGDPFYSVKLGLEQTLFVLVSPSFSAQGNLSVKYTERRFSDAKRLLADKGSVEGLAYLDKQVATTKTIIEKGSDVKAQQQLAQTYINTLKDVSSQLEAEKQAIAAAPSTSTLIAPRPSPVPTSPPTPTPTRPPLGSVRTITPTHAPTPTSTQPPPPPTPTPVPQQEQQDVMNQISETQETIEQTINDLQHVVQAAGAGGRQEGRKEIKEDVKEQKRDNKEKRKEKD